MQQQQNLGSLGEIGYMETKYATMSTNSKTGLHHLTFSNAFLNKSFTLNGMEN